MKKIFNLFSLAIFVLFLSLSTFRVAFADEQTNTAQPLPTPSVTQTSEPTQSPEPTQTVEPTSTPEPTPSATTEPTSTPEPSSTPTATSTTEPSPTPSPISTTTQESTPSAGTTSANTSNNNSTPQPTQNSIDPILDADIPQVVVGTTYGGVSGAKVKFNSIAGSAGSLTMVSTALPSSQANQLGAFNNTVYEITSSMPNGSFTYDLTLPYPSGVTGTNFKVLYASSVNTLLNNPTQVTQSITDNGDGTFTIHNLDHFTVFVVVNPNSQANCDSVTLGTTPGSTCYTTVQAAVNAASDGDTINIGNTGSPYNETVYVNKQLIINGVGNPSVNAFVLQTTPVTITGITTSVTIETPTNVALTNPVHSGNHTNISITGNGAPNAVVNWRIYDNTGASVAGLDVVDSSGNINAFADVSSLSDGPLTLFLFLTSGTYSSNTVTASSYKDTIAPAPANNLSITNPVNNSNKTTVSISGNAEAGTTVYWMVSDGAGNATAGTTTASGAGTFSVSNIDVSNLNDGTIFLDVTLGDSAGNFSSTSTITATKDVVAPTVSAGPNTIKNSTFTTSASASDPSPSSGIASYSWAVLSQPTGSNVTFGTPNALNTTVTPDTDGTYAITLTVTDTAGNSATSQFILTWDTVAPSISGLTNATTSTTVTRTATVSDPAPSSGIASTAWTQQSGPGTITFGTPNSTSTTISADTDGTYIVRFSATDNAGNVSNQDITFIWDTTNPTVSAGSTPAPQKTTFTQVGSASDATSGIASVSWSQVSGPGTVTFGSVNSTTTTVSADQDGTYVIRLTAVDNAGNTSSSTVSFVWDTQSPTVNAGSDVVTNTTFTQNGSATDPSPSSGGLTYAWSKTSGPGNVTFGSANSASTTVSTDADGIYVIRLTVTDAAGNSSFDEFSLTWDTTQPTVSAGTTPQNRNATFTQVGSASDSLSGVASVTWSQTSGPGTITFGSPNATTTTITADTDGTYTIQLSATDNAGNTRTSTLTLNWDTQNPVVNAGPNTAQRSTFTTSANVTDPAPSTGIASYSWTQVSGPGTITFGTPNALNTTITADTDGSYVIQLAVTDNAGNTGTSQFTLDWDTVSPTVSAGSNQLRNGTFTQTGTVTDPAPSSGGFTYQWAQVSGPGTITFGSANAISTSITASTDGVYVISFTATDNAGNSATSSFSLTWDTTAPAGNWTAPAAGSTVSGNVNLSANASDLNGVASVTFLYRRNDGVDTFHTIATDTTSPYATVWDTNSIAIDNYVIRIAVLDNAGNVLNVDQNVDVATVILPGSVNVTSINQNSAVITWVTDDPTTSRVIYDTTSHPSTTFRPNYGYTYSTGTQDTSTKVTNHSFTVTGLNASTKYYFRVVSADGSPEAVSDEYSFTTSAQPAQGAGSFAPAAPSCSNPKPGSAPALLSAKVKGNKILLTWSKAKDPVTYYLIKYGLGHDSYQFGVPNVGNVTEYEIGGLQEGVTYYFRVRAGNGCNADGEFSNELSAKAGGSQTFTQSFGQEVINVTSRALGVREAFALEYGAEDLSTESEKESTESAEASASASPQTRMSPTPALTPTKKPGDMLRYILLGAGLILLTAGSALYYTTLQKKR